MTMKACPLFRYSSVLKNIGVKTYESPTTDDSGSPFAFTVERTQRLCFRIKSKISCLFIKIFQVALFSHLILLEISPATNTFFRLNIIFPTDVHLHVENVF